MSASADDHGFRPVGRRVRVLLAGGVGVVLLAVAVATALLWPGRVGPPAAPAELAHTENVGATVVAAASRSCGSSPCVSIRVRVDAGPDAGQVVALPDMQSTTVSALPAVGDEIVVSRVTILQTGQTAYNYVDYQRSKPLWLLALAFAVVVVGVARLRGAAALAGLALTWLILVELVIPELVDGRNATAVALTGTTLIALVVLYVAHGLNARTTVALLGTVAALTLTTVLAVVFDAFAHLTGLASEEVGFLAAQGVTVDAYGLLLAGTVIGTLGVLTDITVTQTVIVWEIHAANPGRGARALHRAAMRIGRDHIASTVYTLVLAYAGASLPLLVLFVLGGQDASNLVLSEVVAEEVARTLLGSIGLVAAVPLTTALAVWAVRHSNAVPANPVVPDLLPSGTPAVEDTGG